MMQKMGPDYLDQDGPNDLRANLPPLDRAVVDRPTDNGNWAKN